MRRNGSSEITALEVALSVISEWRNHKEKHISPTDSECFRSKLSYCSETTKMDVGAREYVEASIKEFETEEEGKDSY